MILGTIRRILKEDLARSGDIPSWVDPFLSPLNQFIDTVTIALRNNLTFQDNFSCKIITQTFTHNVEREISIQAKSKIIGIIPISTGKEILDAHGFQMKGNGNLGITLKFVSTTAEVDCTIVVLFS